MSGVEGSGVEGGALEDIDTQVTTLAGQVSTLAGQVPPAEYAKRHVTDANGDLTVTFPGGLFPGGSVPVVRGDVVAGVATDQYQIEMVGQPTPTTAVFKVRKFAGLSLSILSLGVVQLFATPGITGVHVRARIET